MTLEERIVMLESRLAFLESRVNKVEISKQVYGPIPPIPCSPIVDTTKPWERPFNITCNVEKSNGM